MGSSAISGLARQDRDWKGRLSQTVSCLCSYRELTDTSFDITHNNFLAWQHTGIKVMQILLQ